MGRIIGIDLGTTNSCVAVFDGHAPTVIHNQEGGRTTPSVVSWTEGRAVVGAPAKRQLVTNPRRTITGAKRLMGRRFASPDVQRRALLLPYQIVSAQNGDAWVQIDNRAVSPQEISAHILGKMRRVAEDYLGESINEAIVTVPAYFDEVQRQATKDAGAIAGLKIRSLLNEPTAAALAYGVHKQRDQRLAVFDLGGGTFDISILALESGVFQVLATNGDTNLGGDDFDNKLVDLLAREFEREQSADVRQDAVALQRLREAAERAKVELSSTMSTDINLPFITVGPGGPLHLQRDIRRGEYENLCQDLLAALEGPCRRALEQAHCTADEMDQVLLVGGMTRMPAVQEKVVEIFAKEPCKGVNPDEIVALGAAAQSGIFAGELQEVVLLDVTPHSLGLKVAQDGMSILIAANTTVPARQQKIFATTQDDQTFVAIEVYQGDNPRASQNRLLGRFILADLPPAPAGQVRIKVTFTIDADGILSIEATELTSGRASSVMIEAASGLSRDELDLLTASIH